jgi:heme A synthase
VVLPIAFQFVALLLLRAATALKLARMTWPHAEATQMMLGVVYAQLVTGILTNIAKLQARSALLCA